MSEITTLEDLSAAENGSYYFVAGTGDPLEEWVTGYEAALAEKGIGKPVRWHRTNGAAINHHAEHGGYDVADSDHFQSDLVCLLFPLDGLDLGRLAIFKIEWQDRWFDDVIMNMRRN